jgi:two-component system, chemotaxis family, chemotaxis protein CheY
VKSSEKPKKSSNLNFFFLLPLSFRLLALSFFLLERIWKMKSLVVEDDFTSRLLLKKILSPFGDYHVVNNGREALVAFYKAKDEGRQYDLVCLDIMMPEMDGQEALKRIRDAEKIDGILEGKGVKIIMTTALGDPKNVIKAHYQICSAYMMKPIDKTVLLKHLKDFRLI